LACDRDGVHASSRTVELAPLAVRAAVGAVNDEKRTADLIFSTGAAVLRSDYWTGKQYREVLSMDPRHIRLDRLNSGAPLLDSHSAWSLSDILGTVEPDSARITDGKGLATVRFSKRADVEPVYQDVRDKVIRSVSIGYRVYKFEEDAPKDGGIPTRTATDWEPYEVSMVAMPADPGAKVRADQKFDTYSCVIVTRYSDADRARRLRLAQARS
jgi:HK97 family phage prohead protease